MTKLSITRQTWKNKADFLLALISYGVGLGNVWRFPYLAYSSGGGAFLIPFIVSSIVVGVPYALIEVALGQWMREGGIGAWNITPILKGIGFANLIIVFLGNVYYEVILAWTLRYLVASFNLELPWKSCNQKWNSACCSEVLLYGTNSSVNTTINNVNQLYFYNNNKNNNTDVYSKNNFSIGQCKTLVDPITEYWERNVLNITDGINQAGSIKWDLFLTLLVSWILVYLSIFRGMKNSQIVVYITAIFPYLFLFTFLIRGLFLPGALQGIIYYLYPDWRKLKDLQVWADAGTQVFYSYGIGISALISLGSYNKFHHNSYRDVTIFTIVNSLTSILSGFVIFSILGYMAHVRNVDISLVAEEGPGLAFIVYPQALALLPWGPIWSVMFFIMLFLLGLGTQLVATEAITTAIIDEYSYLIKHRISFKYTKEFLSGVNVFISFLCGLPMITYGGMYVFQIFDYYAASRSLLFVGLFEIIAISYVYGVNKFYENLQAMWKFKLGPWLKIMWVFATPAFTLVLIVFTTMTYQDLTYNRTYKYPRWALTFGWFLSVSSLICIPSYAVFAFLKAKGSFKNRLSVLIKPQINTHHHNKTNFTKEINSIEEDLAERDTFLNVKHEYDTKNCGISNSINNNDSINDINDFVNTNHKNLIINNADTRNKYNEINEIIKKSQNLQQSVSDDDNNSNFSTFINSQTRIKI